MDGYLARMPLSRVTKRSDSPCSRCQMLRPKIRPVAPASIDWRAALSDTDRRYQALKRPKVPGTQAFGPTASTAGGRGVESGTGEPTEGIGMARLPARMRTGQSSPEFLPITL